MNKLSEPKIFLASTGLIVFLNFLFVLVLLLNSIPVTANEDDFNNNETVNDISEIGQASLLFKQDGNYRKAAQLSINVDMTVSGMINRVSVTQNFSNTTDNWQEGIYVFPLPENAAVDHMRLKIGDRIIEGQIKEKQEAKQVYQQAKKEGKRAALTEQERPNIFTTSVANIAPHETVKVEIEYQQTVSYDNGVFSLRFPMIVGPRYIQGKQRIEGFAGTGWAINTDEVPDAARITPPVLQPGSQRKNKASIKVDLDAGLAIEKIESPYHQIDISKQGDQYLIELKQESVLANRDFELIWQPHPSAAPKAALFTEEKNGDAYAMIMMVPPEIEKSQTLNREIIYVIDTSGSMGGQSIVQARTALELALSRLKPGDRFNVIQFNSYTSSLFKQPEPVTPESLQAAIHYVRSLKASGGTEIATALRTALANQTDNNDLRQVIFLTDGSIGNEQALFEIIQHQLGRSRLFTIGIGSAPNSHFMQRAANFGRGTHTYIGKLDEVQSRMQALFEKIESPVLKDIRIDWDQTNNSLNLESWPQKISDLYRGEPLLITVKADQLPDQIKITGEVVNEKWSSNLKLNGGQNRKGISTLWARKKIAALMEQKRDAEFESIKQIIIETALEHHLVSKFTSLVAVDVTPVRPGDQGLDSKAISTHLPEGWEYNKVFGHQFPATATDARINFIIGLILLLIATLFYLTRRHDSYV
ncbi:MAG: marine proteobacterial sortase target protein [Proteobacteria bacterium]|nr:marine proteobacterial sortase target protein [Pseudomonadota bacterium]